MARRLWRNAVRIGMATTNAGRKPVDGFSPHSGTLRLRETNRFSVPIVLRSSETWGQSSDGHLRCIASATTRDLGWTCHDASADYWCRRTCRAAYHNESAGRAAGRGEDHCNRADRMQHRRARSGSTIKILRTPPQSWLKSAGLARRTSCILLGSPPFLESAPTS